MSAPGGLTLSPDGERVLAPRPPKLTGSLLNPGDWVGPANTHFLVREPVLLAGVAQAEPAARTNARLDLAKFYFANGDDAEALGVLRVAEGTVPNLTDDPVVRLMQGAAEVTIGQLDGAASDLSDHALDGRVDTALWRSVLAAAKGDWVEAGTLAAQGLPALKTYPPVLRRKVAVPVAEALFRRGDKADAEALAQDVLKSDPTRGQRDYASVLLGRIAAEKGDVAEAEKLWQSAAVSPEIDLGRAQGAYALAVTQLDKKEIARPDAIAAIDRLRYAWRGDDFEIMVLRKLADLYAEDSDYRMAFETLQRIPAGFPDTPAARDATAQMQKTFADIFLGPTADTLPPLTALALYDEFKELTPAGAQGDAIVRKLADRLVSVDLLDRAGNLLDEQVKTRLSGIDQARVATQLALVRLMDNRPRRRRRGARRPRRRRPAGGSPAPARGTPRPRAQPERQAGRCAEAAGRRRQRGRGPAARRHRTQDAELGGARRAAAEGAEGPGRRRQARCRNVFHRAWPPLWRWATTRPGWMRSTGNTGRRWKRVPTGTRSASWPEAGRGPATQRARSPIGSPRSAICKASCRAIASASSRRS